MKKQFILCLLISAYIIIPKNASAQYKSVFGDSTTSWSVIEGQCLHGYWSFDFLYVKDTIIKDTTYKKIAADNYWKFFLREDTIMGRLWKRDNALSNEYLIMDLSLQKGDSFQHYNSDYGEFFMLRVDTVFNVTGKKMIQFNEILTCSYKEKFLFVEGSGPSGGLNYIVEENNITGYLVCHHKDKERVFTSKRFKDKCDPYYIGIEPSNINEMEIIIYPNPTNGAGIITFQNEKNACVNLEIYDLNGKRIFSNSTKAPYITFDISTSKNGVYIYKLMNEKGEFSSGKIFKK